MNTFNNGKRSAEVSTFDPSDEETASRSAGFSLIELLVVATTVSVLIAMLLPAIQRKREEYAANKATQNLTAMMAASSEYFRMRGSYPNMLSDLAQFCAASPGSCSLNQGVLSGITGGYIYGITISSEGFECVAEPEVPGITGSVTLTIGPNVTDAAGNAIVISTPTPGSDAARKRALNNIMVSGASTAVQLLALDSTGAAASQIRAFEEVPSIVNDRFNTLDTNRDGMVAVSEINSYSPTLGVNGGITVFLNAVNRNLMWDTLSEQDRQAIVVGMSDLDTTQPLLFSYQGLRDLTIIDWGDGNPDEAIAKLNAAEAAEMNGNINRKAKFLKQYRKIVKQGAGTLVTSTNANTLITISTTL